MSYIVCIIGLIDLQLRILYLFQNNLLGKYADTNNIRKCYFEK